MRKGTVICGVYAIVHVPSGRAYIGGSVDIVSRYTNHRYHLRRGTHKTAALQELWMRDGEASFKEEIWEDCVPEKLREREDYWIKKTPDCLNTFPAATGTAGLKRQVPGQAEAARRRWARPEYREKQLERRGDGGRLVRRSEIG